MGEGAGRRGRRWSAIAAGAALLGTASCTGKALPTPASPEVVDVGMTEYRFDFEAPRRAGRVVFRVRNLGRLDHELLLVELPADLPPLEEQLQSDKRKPVSNLGRVALRKPGTTGTFATDLAPGRYAMVCFVRDPDGSQHAVKGMAEEFRVS